jgi:hypothetical protein
MAIRAIASGGIIVSLAVVSLYAYEAILVQPERMLVAPNAPASTAIYSHAVLPSPTAPAIVHVKPAQSAAAETSKVATSSTFANIYPGDQPESTLLAAGALDIPFTTFVIEAADQELHITSITIQLTGLAASAMFEAVAILDDEDEEISNEKSFNSLRRAVFPTDILIPAGESMTFTVVGNMSDDVSEYDGQMPSMSIVHVGSSMALSGALPITGTAHTVNSSLAIGSLAAMRSPLDTGIDIVRYIDERSVTFSAIRLTAVEEDALLSSVTWDQAGTASASDVDNVRTYVDGVAYGTERDGRYFTASFETPIRIPRGRSVDVSLVGDFVHTAANRTVKFDVRRSEDIGAAGGEFGFGISVSASANTATSGNSVFITSDGSTDGEAGTPFYSGAIISVRGGTVNSIGKP